MTPERFRRLRRVLSRRQPDLTMLLEGVHKPHNLSAVVRSCDAVGVLEAHMVPVDDPEPMNREVSAGSAKWVPVTAWADVGAAAQALGRRGFQLVAAHPDPKAVDFRALDYTAPTCFVLGSELRGLSERALDVVDRTVVIPMLGMVRSLNVSVAGAVLLYEAQRQREAAGAYAGPRLEPERFRRRLFEWAYPELAARCRDAEVPYPALDENGAIVEMPPLPGLVDTPRGGARADD